MINAQLQGLLSRTRSAPRTHHIGAGAFWSLFVVEAALIIAVLLFTLHLLLPARAPLGRSADYNAVRDAIWSRLNGATPDPLIEVSPGVTVRESSVRGFSLGGQTYYYHLEGHRGFDPLSRGVVGKDAIEVVLRDDAGPAALVIYRLLDR